MNNIIYPLERRSGWRYFDSYSDLLNGFFDTSTKSRSTIRTRTPVTDISETDAAYVLKAELPGIRKEDLAVSVNDYYLLIEAEQANHQEDSDDGQVIQRESSIGKFSRSLRLGSGIDKEDISAEYRDGILRVILPKAKEAQPRKVEVQLA